MVALTLTLKKKNRVVIMSFRALCATGHEKNDRKITILTSQRATYSRVNSSNAID